MPTLTLKTLYLGDIAIGHVHSWAGAAQLLNEIGGPDYSGPELSRIGHESRDALFLPAMTLTRRAS